MLSKQFRFHGHNSLRFVYQRGTTVRGPLMNLKVSLNSRRSHFRCAVVVSRKVSKAAAVRNRIRRRIYELVRLESDRISQPYDLVFTVFHEQAADLPAAELKRQVVSALRAAKVYETGLHATIKTGET